MTFLNEEQGLNQMVLVTMGKTILELAIDHKIPLSHSCGGSGSCGTCLIRLEHSKGELPPREELEEEMANERDFEKDERLACQVVAEVGMVAIIEG